MWHNNISERSSTRLHAPPGGKQQFNIFGGGPPSPTPIRKERSAPQQENVQRMSNAQPVKESIAKPMSQAAAYGKRNDADIFTRPSTFVHAAPGGQQQFNIFGGPCADEPAKRVSQKQASPMKNHQSTSLMGPSSKQPSNAPRSNMFAEFAPVNNNKAVHSQRRDDTDIHSKPSTRVHAPPGGKCSNIFG